jgi:hypothetical protein
VALFDGADEAFPRLSASRYTLTSVATPRYNCIAWAAGDDRRFWWPSPSPFFYWPPDAPREPTIQAFVAAFGLFGYMVCSKEDCEEGIEKVAVFALDGVPTHAARQLPEGSWTSKLGSQLDLSHELRAVEGPLYGQVAVLLARSRPRSAFELRG